MKDQRLLASAALFRELYDNDKDIYDVISEFIRASILLNSSWSFNATECAQYLEQTFGFQIPDAVIKTCLKKRLKGSGEVVLYNGVYSVTDKLDRSKSIQSDYNESKKEYDGIARDLVSHVKNRLGGELAFDEGKLIADFNDYLLDEKTSNGNADYIRHFLLSNQENLEFKTKLNRIEEGLVLYAGIQYSSELSTLGKWSGDLVVFLDTEHLLSAAGLNGVLYKKIFDDFNSLVKEVNANKRKAGSITLRYFEETNSEIDNFFFAAEKIVEACKQVDPSKTAMRDIVNGCKSKSDVVIKKAAFFDKLRALRIEAETPKDYYQEPKYNVESAGAIETLQAKLNNKVEAGRYSGVLKLFTKINSIRKGENNVGIERIAAIFMTENRLTQAVAFSDIIFAGKGEIPFATNIEFLTERLWFKLNKGFGEGKITPTSFDVITKAKLVLSSQVNHAVAETYKDMKAQYERGEISEEAAALLITELRAKPAKPEDFSIEIIEGSMDFLSENLIERVLREKSIEKQKLEDGQRAIEKLQEIKLQERIKDLEIERQDRIKDLEIERQQRIKINEPIKKIAVRQYRLLLSSVYIVIPALSLYLLAGIYTDSDTVMSVVFGLLSIISFIVSVVKVKTINRCMWALSKKYYKNELLSLKKSA